MREARQCVFKSVRSLKGATKRRVRSLKGATKRREGNCDYFSQFIKPYSHTLEVENKSAPMPKVMIRGYTNWFDDDNCNVTPNL